jgi:putative colanic acid biosynthesis UDP-glucose lipid carrier transferase
VTVRRAYIRSNADQLMVLLRIVDGVWLGGSLWILCTTYGMPWGSQYDIAAVLAVALFYLLAGASHFYRSWRGALVGRELGAILSIWLGVSLGMLLVGYATKTSAEFSRRVLLTWLFVAPTGLVLSRVVARSALYWMRQRGRNIRRAALVGGEELGLRLADEIVRSRWMGIELVGVYGDVDRGESQTVGGRRLGWRGGPDALISDARGGKVDIVFIALPMRREDEVNALIDRLADTMVAVYLVPNYLLSDLLHSAWTEFADIPVVNIFEAPFYGVDGWVKRAEDIIIASAAVAVFGIPMCYRAQCQS